MPSAPAPGRPGRAELAGLGVVLAIAAGLRFHGIGWGLPDIFEEATPFRTAWRMWGFAPLQHFDLNPHWFTYPSLIFYLQMAGQAFTFALLRLFGDARSLLDLRIQHFDDPTPYYLVGRSITALFGTATVLPAWRIARRAGGLGAAVLSGLAVAIHPDLVAKSQVIEVDVPLACLMAVTVDLALAAFGRPSWSRWVAVGVAAGLATACKYPGAVLALPVAWAAWQSSRAVRSESPASPVARRGGAGGARRSRRATRPGSPALPGVLLALAAMGLAFFIASPFVLIDHETTARDFALGRDLMTLEHFGVAAGAAYATYARDWFTRLMGWPLGIASLAAITAFAVRRRPWALMIALIFVPFVAVVGSWQMKADRYLLPMIPLAACAGAIGLAAIGDRLGSGSPAGRRAALVGLGLVAIGPIAWRLPEQRAMLRTDTRTLARRWIETHIPAGSLVMSEVLAADLHSPVSMQNLDADVVRELIRRRRLDRVYAYQTVPMFVLRPERSAKFYDLERMREADLLVVSSGVRERYRGEPENYRPQLSFYAELERRWPRLARFEPAGGPGPVLEIYRNPDQRVSFAARPTVPALDTVLATSGERTGSEGYWYFNLGLNYELIGQREAAKECHLMALRFGTDEPEIYGHSALRLASLLRGEGRPGLALATLRMAMERAPAPRIAGSLAGAARELAAGREVAPPLSVQRGTAWPGHVSRAP